MPDIGHFRGSVGSQACNDKSSSCSKISCSDRRAGHTVHSFNNCSSTVNFYPGAHSYKLIYVHKPVFKYSLSNDAHIVSQRQERHELRLKIRRETRVRHGLNIHCPGMCVRGNTNLRFLHLNTDADLTQFGNYGSKVFRHDIFKDYIPFRNSRSRHIRACLYPIRNYCMTCASQLIHTADSNDACTCAYHFCSHLSQKVCEIYDFRFPGYVLQDGAPFGKRSCHHRILSCAYAWIVQVYVSAAESFWSSCLNVSASH